jgi:signal transduction histidine kinase
MVRALYLGGILALLKAAIGGWLIGRKTLQPLSDMAAQASRIDGREPSGRLSTPNPDDELGVLAASFNDLLQRLATALHQQRQFMADASHELRTPVSVVRTSAQVTLSQTQRPEGEYREGFTIVEEQATRLSRLVEAMFAPREAHRVPLHRVRQRRWGAGGPGRSRALRGRRGPAGSGLRGTASCAGRQSSGQRDPARQHRRHGRRRTLPEADGILLRVTNDGPGIAARASSNDSSHRSVHGRRPGAAHRPVDRWAHGGARYAGWRQAGPPSVRFPRLIDRSSRA